MTEYNLRTCVVDVAMGWLGCRETDGSHKKIIDCYNSQKPLPRGYAVQYTDAWCATFVSAVAITTGLTDIIPTECSCPKQVALFQAMHSWKEDDCYVPRLGDIIYYDWEDSGRGDNQGRPNHVGIVAGVQGGVISVVEGNKGNAVALRNIAVGGKYIRGYGLPDYRSKSDITLEQALDHLADLNVINSPDYWMRVVADNALKWLDQLIIKSAAKITREGERADTVEEAISALVSAEVINSPDYWMEHCQDMEWLDELLKALGGAVK